MTAPIDLDRIMAPPRTILWNDFVDAFTDAVNERGRDFTYPKSWMYLADPTDEDSGQCMYVRDGQAACIIGLTLAKCGVPLDWLSGHEGLPGAAVCRDAGVEGVLGSEVHTEHCPMDCSGHFAPNPRGLAINAAQGTQDGGGTWGQAQVSFHSALAAVG